MSKPTPEIDLLFENSSNFILIGITGYTGSGSKTFSNFLRSEQAPSKDLVQDIYSDYFEERKFEIAKRFLNTGDQWKSFSCIKISHIILMLLQYISPDETEGVVDKIFDLGYIKKEEKDDLKNHIDSSIESIKNIKKDIENNLERYIFDPNNCRSNKKYETFSKIINNHKSFTEKFRNIIVLVEEEHKELKENLKKINPSVYTILFQILGFNIRKGINLSIHNESIITNIHYIPEVINRIIKIYRLISTHETPTRIVIETIRNSHEIDFLRERYSQFYMFSIGTDEQERLSYMAQEYNSKVSKFISSVEQGNAHKGLSDSEDNRLYEEKDKDMAEEFWLSNVSKCLQLCDIHLYNDKTSGTHNDLRAQICWYLSLILHPGLFTPKSSERVMNIAFQAKLSSGCLSRQIGAAVTDSEDTVLSIGWNDVPKGQTPCILRSVHGCFTCTPDNPDYSEYEKKDANDEDSIKGKLLSEYNKKTINRVEIIKKDPKNEAIVTVNWKDKVNLNYCFKDIENTNKSGVNNKNQVHTRAVHAEENAMLQIGKMTSIPPEKLYTTASPCVLCAKKASELGIKEIIFVDPYTDICMTHTLKYHNSPKLIQFYGAVKNGYQKLYTPKLPMKNELDFITQKLKDKESASEHPT